MSASFVYACELFDAQTVERLARHYVASLNALVSGQVSMVNDVELMSDAEREQFVGLVTRLVADNNHLGRARLRLT